MIRPSADILHELERIQQSKGGSIAGLVEGVLEAVLQCIQKTVREMEDKASTVADADLIVQVLGEMLLEELDRVGVISADLGKCLGEARWHRRLESAKWLEMANADQKKGGSSERKSKN